MAMRVSLVTATIAAGANQQLSFTLQVPNQADPILRYFVTSDSADGTLFPVPYTVSAILDSFGSLGAGISLVNPQDIELYSGGVWVASNAYYVVSGAGTTLLTSNFAWSGTARDLSTLLAATPTVPYPLAAVTVEIPPFVGIAQTAQARLSTACFAPGGVIVPTTAVFTATIATTGLGTLNLIPNDVMAPVDPNLAAVDAVWLVNVAGVTLPIRVPDAGGLLTDLVVDLVNGHVVLSNPVAPTLATATTGGTVLAGTYGVALTYVNQQGETTTSVAASIVTTGATSTITISSPTPEGTGTQVATGWYAYVTQVGGSTMTRQQTAGSPTGIGTNLVLTAPPTSSGAAPPAFNSAGTLFGSFIVGAVTIDATEIVPDLTSRTGTYNVPPVTLQDQLRALTQYPVTHITATTYTALATDRIIDADGTSNAVAVTLLSPTGYTGLLAIKAINVAHAVTILGTVDGAAGPITPALNATYVFFSDGTAWRLYGTTGGTGLANPMTTLDDLIVGGASGAAARLAKGTSGQLLTIDASSGHISWDTLPDATTTVPGILELDTPVASGHPVALSVPRLNAPLGVAPLGSDLTIPSMSIPGTPGAIAEAGRWVKKPQLIFASGAGWKSVAVAEPCALFDAGLYKMWFSGQPSAGELFSAVGYATCPGTSDPTVAANWTEYGSNPVVAACAIEPNVIKLDDGTLRMYYSNHADMKVAGSTDGITWTVLGTALATGTGGISWWNHSAVWKEAQIWHMLANGGNSGGTNFQMYHATSTDGISFTLDGFGVLPLTAGGISGRPSLPLPHKRNGRYQLWTHASVTGVNADLYHFTSPTPDFHTATMVGAGPILTHSGSGIESAQIADPCVIEVNGISYLFYDGDTGSTAGVMVASFAGGLASLVDGSAPTSGAPSIKHNGTTIGTEPAINFIEGTNVNLTVADNSGASRVDVTIAATGGGSGEILVEDGASNPPIMLTNEAQDDFIYAG